MIDLLHYVGMQKGGGLARVQMGKREIIQDEGNLSSGLPVECNVDMLPATGEFFARMIVSNELHNKPIAFPCPGGGNLCENIYLYQGR